MNKTLSRVGAAALAVASRRSAPLVASTSRSFHTFPPLHVAAPKVECQINSRSRNPGSEVQRPHPQRLATSMLIDGKLVEKSSDGEAFETICPADGTKLMDIPQAGKEDVNAAVEAAHRAFNDYSSPDTWPSLPPRARGALLYKLSSLISQHVDELALLESLDNGKTINQSRNVDAQACAAIFKYWAGWADKMENGRVIDIGTQHFDYTLHQPVGVCALIVPWNLPLIAAAAKIGPALCAGNTVILKPAEQTPLSTLRLAELIVEAGFPKGVINILPGDGQVGSALVNHPMVNKISFTGSTPVGLKVGSDAAKQCKRVSLELGGKNPVVVHHDTDMSLAVESVHNALFWNEGEACASGSRIFVHEKIYDEFLEKSIQRAMKRKVAHPFAQDGQQGAQVSEEQMNRILGYISSASSEGAELELGGYRMGDKGYYIAPTVFSQVQDHMTVSKEEIFGPVMCLHKYTDIDEVIQRANHTPFGLAAGVFTRDQTIGHELTRRIHAGLLFWNCYHVVDIAAPFGGMKHSGQGREGGGMYGLEEYMEVKNVVQKV